jgi:hypothetical protein
MFLVTCFHEAGLLRRSSLNSTTASSSIFVNKEVVVLVCVQMILNIKLIPDTIVCHVLPSIKFHVIIINNLSCPSSF